jgi:hypothetical protein
MAKFGPMIMRGGWPSPADRCPNRLSAEGADAVLSAPNQIVDDG